MKEERREKCKEIWRKKWEREGGKTGRKGLRVVDGFDGNIVTCTHVMKCLCWPMVWISFTRKVWSLTSPGRRHSSSYRPDKRIQNDWDKFRFVL